MPSVTPSKLPDEQTGLPYWVWIIIAIGGVMIIVCFCCGIKAQTKRVKRNKEKARAKEQKKFYARSGDIVNGLETRKEDFARNPIQDIPAPGREV
jgi:hypothetical protein